MKRLISIFLAVLLLSGCTEQLKEPVSFYYIRSGYEEDMSNIVGVERREASGHRGDLSYLMALYFMGPADEELLAPLPGNTNMLSVALNGSQVVLQLSDTADSVSDAQFTVACACLTLTCLELTGAETVTIISGTRSATLDEERLLLRDLSTAVLTEESQ